MEDETTGGEEKNDDEGRRKMDERDQGEEQRVA